jgi:DNA-directed RNA polymerase subunit M/transcription elongation factor TFIIS
MPFYTAMSAELGTKVGSEEPYRKILSPSLTTPLDTIPQTVVSESKPSAFPSALRAKRSAVQTLSAEDRKTEAITEKTCERCGRKEMFFTTVQLRSADEGSTVFFRCVCGYKYVISKSISLLPDHHS